MQVGNYEVFSSSSSSGLIGTPTNHGLPIGQGPNTDILWTSAPTNGQILIGSTGADPLLGNLVAGSNISISNGPGSITISATNNLGIPTDHGLPIGQGIGNDLVWTSALTDGQILIGSTGSDPVLSNLIAGANISITNGPGTITISAAGSSGFVWQLIGASQTLVTENGYICTSGGILNLALPASGSLGDVVEVVLDGSSGWVITQSASSRIVLGSLVTSTGGTLSSTAQGDSVRLICQSANRWNVVSSMGNIITT